MAKTGRQARGDNRVDVVVVGAGLSGLVTARRLVRADLSVAVLESRDRVGGRLFTHVTSAGPVDLGGSEVEPTHRRIAALAEELGEKLEPLDLRGARRVGDGARVGTVNEDRLASAWRVNAALTSAAKKLEELGREVSNDGALDTPQARAHDATTVAHWCRSLLGEEGQAPRLFAAWVRALTGAEPSEVSLLALLRHLRGTSRLARALAPGQGEGSRSFPSGAQAITKALAQELGERVVLQTPVRGLTRDEAGVVVESTEGNWFCRRVVLALPPSEVARLELQPPLPAHHDQLRQRLGLGAVITCAVVYERPFWRDAGLSGRAVSLDETRVHVSDATPRGSARGVLLCRIAGADARRWSEATLAERRDAVIATLARLFGAPARQWLEYADRDWQSVTGVRGGPSVVFPPGVLTGFGGALRDPIDRVHFAGAESARECPGTIEGAVEAGQRAAEEVLQALEKSGRVAV